MDDGTNGTPRLRSWNMFDIMLAAGTMTDLTTMIVFTLT
jgi:hypothetical protein